VSCLDGARCALHPTHRSRGSGGAGGPRPAPLPRFH
jgi:hypothetical protein